MRILHILPRFVGGGPERHLLTLAAAWRDAGLRTEHRIAVLEPPISAQLLIQARRLGMTVLVRPGADALDEAIRDTDVLEISYWNHPVLLDLLRRKMPPARVIVNCVVAGVSPPQVLGADLGRFADAMLLASPVSRQTPAVKHAAGAGKIVDVVAALADMSRLDGFAARRHDGVRVGYVGLVEPAKMHPRFAELTAAVRSPGIRFEVFGGGSWAPELEDRLASLGAAGRVHFHGHTEDLREALSAIDVFGYPLAPDTYATSEKAIQEAMWVGIPPVVLAGTGAAAMVAHRRTGLVCPTDADYPAAIELLAADDDLRHRLGEAARNHARANFDPATNSLRFRGVFEAVAALPRRTRQPLPGCDESAARRFVLSLGDLGGAFSASLSDSPDHRSVAEADVDIARASAVLAHGEGGIVHYRNSFPDDGTLRLWSGLVAVSGGDSATARDEFDAAAALGVPAERIERAVGSVTDGSGLRGCDGVG